MVPFRRTRLMSVLAVMLVLCSFMSSAKAADALLPENARLAIIGDSITEQKQYSRFMEIYLLACMGRTDIKVFQYGWGGEQASGFASRMANDLADFKPTVATTCYGMNDGGYRLFEAGVGTNYENNMKRVVEGFKTLGVKTVVLGSPGAVDSKYFARANGAWGTGTAAEGYNDSLRQLGEIDQKLATENKMLFADVHAPMMDAMNKAKAALGAEYDVCGKDGVHPGPNGHLIMASAFLKALGCDGQLATIVIDMKGSPTVSAGNKVLSSAAGTVQLQSTRYPFVHSGDAKSSSGTRSITAFFPFNEELNRWTLKVVGLTQPRAKVTWGAESHEFTKEQLTAGINLAAEFTVTPFDAQFAAVNTAVANKQQFETFMIKNVISGFRGMAADFQDDADLKSGADHFRKSLNNRQIKLSDAVVAAIKPVEHTIAVTPIP